MPPRFYPVTQSAFSFWGRDCSGTCVGSRRSLVQTALTQIVPGKPDIYHWAELWDFSLDPDNQRPMDYHTRISLLAQVSALSAP
jgi:maltooligosyltrehalose synthase